MINRATRFIFQHGPGNRVNYSGIPHDRKKANTPDPRNTEDNEDIARVRGSFEMFAMSESDDLQKKG